MIPNPKSMWDRIGEIPQIARGQVWCHSCGVTQYVDGVACMQRGWPKCCGSTMSIDSLEERARRTPTSPEGKTEGGR